MALRSPQHRPSLEGSPSLDVYALILQPVRLLRGDCLGVAPHLWSLNLLSLLVLEVLAGRGPHAAVEVLASDIPARASGYIA